MTDDDTHQRLVAVLDATGPVLLDFDGPITYLLPPPANAELAEAARRPLWRAGISIPTDLVGTLDHMAVLRFAGTHSAELLNRVETICATGEIAAARHSKPTPGADAAMRAMRRAERPIIILSNNEMEAIETYLYRNDLAKLVTAVVGRRRGQPELMKPATEPIDRALRILGAAPAECVLVGDSITDIEVSNRSGVRSIGYAKTPQRGLELARAGADAVVSSMSEISAALGH